MRILEMRKGWTDHVAEVRRKGNRGKKTMTHREAMKVASVTWPKMKAKLLRKAKRQQPAAKPRVQKPSARKVENGEEKVSEES